MPLYVVLQHPSGRQTAKNGWQKDKRLVDSIVTSEAIATLCNVSQIGKEHVYIHRCAWGSDDPEITSKARVESVSRTGRDYLIVFSSPEPVRAWPKTKPFRGQEYYFADPPR